MHTHARFPFPKDGRPSCSPLTRQRAHDHTRSTMYPENTTRARPCSGMGASLGARALCALLGRAPLLTSLRARRSGASNAAGPAVAAYGRKPAAHTQPGPASRREEGLTALRAPRIARTPPPLISAIRTSPRLGSAVIPYGDVVAIDARQLECLLCVDVFPPTHRDVSLV